MDVDPGGRDRQGSSEDRDPSSADPAGDSSLLHPTVSELELEITETQGRRAGAAGVARRIGC